MAFLSLQIKPNDEWLTAVISPDSSVSIEIINPLFDIDAGGGFSYPFTLSVEANQHLFPTLTNNHGAHVYDLIYHKPFRLYAGGVPLFHGIVDMDDEVEIETQNDGTHTVAINLASDNQELSALLEGVNCQDVPVKDKIPVGTEFRSINFTFYDGNKHGLSDYINGSPHKVPHASYSIPIPPHVFSLNKYKPSVDGSGEWINTTNVAAPYPKPYCNVRVGIQAREKQSDGTYKKLREYELFDADRANSGICFYILYFFDCLFADLGIAYDSKNLQAFEDMKRLAFFSTKCECDAMPTAKDYNLKELQELFAGANLELNTRSFTGAKAEIVSANAYTKYANSKNFPDTDAANIVQDFQNAFGVRFIYDSEMQHCKAVFVKSVLNDRNPVISASIIHKEEQADRNIKGVKMTFGVDDEENTSYNFKDNDSVVVQRRGFASIEVEKKVNDTHTYYDIVTGNMYRIKVDEDATTEEELHPSMFEIKQFGDAWMGDITNDDFVRSIEVAFSPAVINRVKNTITDSKGRTLSASSDTESSQEPIPFVFIDKEMSDAETVKLYNEYGVLSAYDDNGNITDDYYLNGTWFLQYSARYGFSSGYIEAQKKHAQTWGNAHLQSVTERASKPVIRYDEDPLATYDAGYTLGIMRGPGNSSGTEIVQEDYDGNGNARWAYVPTSYAFTADSIDEYGRPYDYNGIAEGGIDMSGRMSLKLWAEKTSFFQEKSINGTSVTVTTAEEARYWLSVLFHDSTIDIFNLHPKTKKEVEEKHWVVDDIDGIVYCLPQLVNGFYAGLYNAIQPDGTVLTPTEFNRYIYMMPSQGDIKGLLIKENATEEDYNNFVGLVNLLYAPESAPAYTIHNVPESAFTDFYPINSANAHRGLFHKFNYEYAYFLIHARIVRLTTTMSLAELSSLALIKWHTFGQYTGLIKQVSYDIDNERGLSDVIIELYYL